MTDSKIEHEIFLWRMGWELTCSEAGMDGAAARKFIRQAWASLKRRSSDGIEAAKWDYIIEAA